MKSFLTKLILSSLLILIMLIGIDWYTTPELEPSEQPKVLITNHHTHYAHGHLTYIDSIINGELRDKYSFTVATPSTSQVYEHAAISGIPVFHCEYTAQVSKFWLFIRDFLKFRSICKEIQPDIIHANGPKDKTFAAWATLFLKYRPKIIRTYHVSKVIKHDIYHLMLCNERIDMNIFVSKSAFAINKDHKGIVPNNYTIIENGVDTSYYTPMTADESIRESLNIPQGAFVFGSCAGLSDYKRIDLILEAAARLKGHYNFHIVALGQLTEKWEKRAEELGVSDIVHFPGYYEDVRPYASIFNVGFVLSTGLETASYALREMLSMGTPVLASNYSGLKDATVHGETGLLVEPGNVDSIVSAMEEFMNMSKDELNRYRQNARKIVEDQFSLAQQTTGIANVYSKLLN